MLVEFANIPVSLDAMLPENENEFVRDVAKACGLKKTALADGQFRLLRKSVDARKKSNVHFVVTVVADLPQVKSEADIDAMKRNVQKGVSMRRHVPPEPLDVPDCSSAASNPDFKRPIVIGAGPAGLFCALYLACAGLRPIVAERGKSVDDRKRDVEAFANGGALDPNSNVQFGEGGAGTFSDGKLNTGTKSPHIRHVLEAFVEAGAPEEILVEAKPHIGTDKLASVVKNLRKRIESLDGEFFFQTKMTSFCRDSSDSIRVTLESVQTGSAHILTTNTLVLAIGHSARDTYKMLCNAGVAMERKPFAAGVRVEHLQSDINRAQYGPSAAHPALSAADYKLATHNLDSRGVYTFCMCPGGTVVAASSEPESLCVNGMSVHARDGKNANSALLVEVRPDDIEGDDVLGGMEFQRQMERTAYQASRSALDAKEIKPYTAPAQTVGDFLAKKYGSRSTKVTPSYPRGVVWTNLRDILPSFISDAMEEALPNLDRKLNGFSDAQAVMTGVESRSSSPVRIIRDRQTLQSINTPGLYPAGEGAGYAGGIMSAATDGLRIAEAIASTLAHSF